MKRPRFLGGVLAGLAICLIAGVAHPVLTTLFAWPTAPKLLITIITSLYAVYLLSQTEQRTGRITATVMWASMDIAGWLFAWAPLPFLLVHLGSIWLLRSLYFYNSALSAVADLGLIVFGAGTAFVVFLHTGSLLLTIWCFFLVQALFAMVPSRLSRRSPTGRKQSQTDNFDQARRRAEAAIHQLATR